MQIIQDSAKLKSYAKAAVKAYQKAGTQIHVALISGIYHAAKTGDPSILNMVFPALRSNDQQAVKLYVRRAHAIIGLGGLDPEGKDADEILAAVAAGQVLDFKKGEFIVVAGHTSDQSQALAKLCEDRFIAPDGETDKMILDRNNFAEVKTLGDEQVLDQLIKLANSLDSDSETRKVDVSDPVRKLLTDASEKAAAYKQQMQLA